MPRQMEPGFVQGNTTKDDIASERKRQELVEWESALLQKSRQMEEALEQFNGKMAKMAN